MDQAQITFSAADLDATEPGLVDRIMAMRLNKAQQAVSDAQNNLDAAQIYAQHVQAAHDQYLAAKVQGNA